VVAGVALAGVGAAADASRAAKPRLRMVRLIATPVGMKPTLRCARNTPRCNRQEYSQLSAEGVPGLLSFPTRRRRRFTALLECSHPPKPPSPESDTYPGRGCRHGRTGPPG